MQTSAQSLIGKRHATRKGSTMSQDFMDQDLLSDFIIEAREHLETIEPNLLELEKEPDNLSLLNEIFRPVHSMKGASGFLGLNKMNGLTHKAENILDELRKGAMPVTSDTMDLILATTDALRQMLDSLENDNTEGDTDTGPMIQTIDALMTGKKTSTLAAMPKKPAGPAAPDPEKSKTGLEPEQKVEPEAEAQPEPEAKAQAQNTARQEFDIEPWLESLTSRPAYTLTAFGEAHLRDFIEEARDNLSSISDGLLELEKHPEGQKDLVNDLFRYFHNIKGNSGIIGYHELNLLTHEAETLLNSLRKDDNPVSRPIIDLLLLAVDVLEALIFNIDPATCKVTPFDTEELLQKLREAVAGGQPSLPSDLLAAAQPAIQAKDETGGGGQESPVGADPEDAAIYHETVGQQFEHIAEALEGMRKDGTNKEFADVMFRSLTTIQNSSSFMDLGEIADYARRTAGVVDQGRGVDLDFSIMADLLDQECAIIKDMIEAAMTAPPHPAPDGNTDADTAGAGPESEPEETSLELEAEAPEQAGAMPAPEAAPESTSESASEQAKVPPAPKQAATPASEHKVASTIRVDHEKLDHLMNLIGELIINRNRYSMLARQLEDSGFGAKVQAIAQNLTETTYSMARISDDLQDTIMKVRMVPVASVFSRFPRLVRDLSRKSGKDVELITEGEDTELDKSVVEVIGDPLVHLVRNSVDHGIEDGEQRRKSQKPLKGRVWLRAFYKGNSVAIEIEDDGKGIDPEKMREVAVRKGIVSPEEVKALDDREATELIFAPGFSSAEVVTDISGRGVGMDVVRTNIKNLKGSININSEVGKGTKFTLSLPLTLAIIDALMVNVDNETFAIPLDAVSETTKIEYSRLTDVKGRKAVTLRGEVLGVVSLAEFLGLSCHMDEQEILNVVVIQDNDRRLGLVVDRLLERQEVVIKPLGIYLGDIKGVSGATIMGDGSVVLILDPHELYLLATSKS